MTSLSQIFHPEERFVGLCGPLILHEIPNSLMDKRKICFKNLAVLSSLASVFDTWLSGTQVPMYAKAIVVYVFVRVLLRLTKLLISARHHTRGSFHHYSWQDGLPYRHNHQRNQRTVGGEMLVIVIHHSSFHLVILLL